MKKILFAASEAAPFIKVGGLGDVAGALPKALCEAGADCRVILPLYSAIPWEKRQDLTFLFHINIHNAWREQYCGVLTKKVGKVIYYFIDNEYYFNRYHVYGETDDAERFAFFSRAVLEVLPRIEFIPDVLHTNDWHTALIPVLQDCEYCYREGYGNIKTVFTIHNIEFQGKYDPYILGSVFGLDESKKPLLFYGDCINLMKGAIETAHAVTTVSESYAGEILDPYYSNGLHHILAARKFKLSGITNGIDTEIFDPATDKNIATNYSFKTRGQKFRNKKALRAEMGLPEGDAPLLAMVGRLTHQKGLDLLRIEFDNVMDTGAQMILLGTGDAEYENFFRDMQNRYPERFRAVIGFDAALAQRIYAGADLFLIPSKFEPCGLTQMISMRYGTLPVVHAVGGLRDTVIPYDHTTGKGNGVNFLSYTSGDMMDAIRRAIALYYDKPQYARAKANAMQTDVSWKRSAEKYLTLYNRI